MGLLHTRQLIGHATIRGAPLMAWNIQRENSEQLYEAAGIFRVSVLTGGSWELTG